MPEILDNTNDFRRTLNLLGFTRAHYQRGPYASNSDFSAKSLYRSIAEQSAETSSFNGLMQYGYRAKCRRANSYPYKPVAVPARKVKPSNVSRKRPVTLDFEKLTSYLMEGDRKSVDLVVDRLKQEAIPREALLVLKAAIAEEIERLSNELHDEPQTQTAVAQSFVDRAQRLDGIGRTDAALDLLYDSIDELMRAGLFLELDRILMNCRPTNLSGDLLLGLLTATLPARSRLSARPKFLVDVEKVFRGRGEYEEGLLAGL